MKSRSSWNPPRSTEKLKGLRRWLPQKKRNSVEGSRRVFFELLGDSLPDGSADDDKDSRYLREEHLEEVEEVEADLLEVDDVPSQEELVVDSLGVQLKSDGELVDDVDNRADQFLEERPSVVHRERVDHPRHVVILAEEACRLAHGIDVLVYPPDKETLEKLVLFQQSSQSIRVLWIVVQYGLAYGRENLV